MANHPIFFPTFHGMLAKVAKMLDAEPDLVRVRDAKNLTPLHVAASRGKHKVAKLLLERGADVEGPSKDNQWTPLVFASYRGHLKAVEVLLAFGAKTTEKHGNPIHYAGQRKHKEICRLLVEHGAVDDLINADNPDLKELFRAAYSYDDGAVALILSKHPDLIDARDKHGRSLLHETCTHGDSKTVRVLLKRGASLDAVDNRGQTPIDRATAHRQRNIVKLLDSHAKVTVDKK